jgi:hypothetical protein
MAQEQRPSVGRVVHYRPPGPTRDWLAAIITQVVGDSDAELVALVVFPPHDQSFTVTAIPRGEGEHSWRWPPHVPPRS